MPTPIRFIVSTWLLGLSALSLAQTPAPQSSATPRTAEDFAQLPFLSGPRLSPDGTRILAEISVGKQKVLGIIAIADGGKNPTFVNLSGNDLLGYSWVNKDWFYAHLGDDGMREGFPFYLTRVVGISADGKTVKPIGLRSAGASANPIRVANDGTPKMLIAQQKSLYLGLDFWPSVVEADISTGRVKTVVDPINGIYDWYADGSLTVRTGIGADPETEASRILYRSGEGQRFQIIDRRSANQDQRKMLIVPQAFAADGKTALTFSNHEGFDWLYEIDLASMEIGKKVFGAAGYDLLGTYSNDAGTAIDGVHIVGNRDTRIWIQPDLAAAQAGLEKALGKDQQPIIVDVSDDRKTMIVDVGGPDQAGSYQIFSPATGKLSLLSNKNNVLKMDRLGKVSTLRYKARDGVQIAAVLTVPADRPSKALPLIVMPHGGPYGIRDKETFDWWAQFVASRGYAVVQPNYRGSGGFGRAFEALGDGEWGAKMQDDLIDVVTHLAGQGIADPNRVCMVGGSYGGYAAMRAAQRDGKLYRCAVSYAGVSDVADMKRTNRSFLYGKLRRAYWKEVAPDTAAISPINFPEQFSTPILIMHGKEDKRVPVAQSRRLAEKLKAAGKPHRYIEQPEGDHHFTRYDDRVQFLKELEAFLKEHNPA